MSMNKKIILATIVYFATCGGMCWYCLGGDIVRDLSQYRQINPGDSRQLQQDKQGYNLNQYLNQRDAQTQEIHNNTINTFKRAIPDTNYNYDSKPRSMSSLDYDRTSGGILPCPE